ncbi:caspase-14 isoform X2 [Magallana gigas]|uniref:caspase-14 isoform X2 n=1 Tax=Magallana gigas TaxID=29159 RepID=UPI00333FFE63
MATKKIPQEARELHNELIADLHDNINSKVDEHDFEKLIHRLKLKLSPIDLKACHNLIDATDKLQKRGHLEPGNYGELIKLVDCIDKNWVNLIREKGETIIEIINKANEPQPSVSSEESERAKKRRLESDQDGQRSNENTDGQTQILKSSTSANADFCGINDFFEKTLNFECHVETDPSKEEVECFLKETACLFNNKRTAAKYYCLLVFIMSHGNEDGIRTNDGKTISLVDIVSYFKNDKLKYFAGKPKCFFIQACRGSSPQGVVDLSDDKEEVMIDQVVGKISIPTDANLLLAYATTPGYYAYRRPNVGSWFFCNLLKIFKEHYEEEHVEDMLIDVKERLAYDDEWQTNEGFKQMPCTWSTLTKRFFLAPQQLAE